MTFSLYAATVPSYVQMLGAMLGLIDKAEAYCAETGLAAEALLQARLAEDMRPFTYQIKSTAVHSLGAIEGVRKGSFSPDNSTPPDTFDALRTRLYETLAALQAIDPAEVNGFVGRPMQFIAGERRLDFTAENFLLSFSQPNFYFHATTAYDLLRWKGVALVKRDFMGMPRMNAPP
ncbi:hypothetical protein DFR29_103139 [Tahibacter aquaticus]|uniref:DUF1993 domain-containing protein n=1 Tax=Tahibacter aquaticus TaxID=520092 RepID=A0A4R6Z4K2_9GAMM|nr:DUF1993 domain-containing protein [Tahibacter aquaticus]TDR46605.1 hypothetical protein DFR29_103139 [Tahibacter aquaticus]